MLTGKCKRRFMKIINERGDDIKLTSDKLPTNFTLQLLDNKSQVGMTVSDATQFKIPANSYVSTTLSTLTHIYNMYADKASENSTTFYVFV